MSNTIALEDRRRRKLIILICLDCGGTFDNGACEGWAPRNQTAIAERVVSWAHKLRSNDAPSTPTPFRCLVCRNPGVGIPDPAGWKWHTMDFPGEWHKIPDLGDPRVHNGWWREWDSGWKDYVDGWRLPPFEYGWGSRVKLGDGFTPMSAMLQMCSSCAVKRADMLALDQIDVYARITLTRAKSPIPYHQAQDYDAWPWRCNDRCTCKGPLMQLSRADPRTTLCGACGTLWVQGVAWSPYDIGYAPRAIM